MAKDENEVVHGLRACLALMTARPADVLRVACSRSASVEVDELTEWASARKLPVLERGDDDLEHMAESAHHEGVCVQTKPRTWTAAAALADLLVRERGVAVALDRVRNPYNVGAILRTAAFFGVDAVILAGALSPQAVRVAEGGAERVKLSRTTDMADTLGRLRQKGVRVVGTDGHSATDVSRSSFKAPVVLVMGNEREGMSERMRAQCDEVVALRGSGAVESLNVAVAAGVLISGMTAARTR